MWPCRWTQWIFLQLFNKGLAYQAEVPVNWCPALGAWPLRSAAGAVWAHKGWAHLWASPLLLLPPLVPSQVVGCIWMHSGLRLDAAGFC